MRRYSIRETCFATKATFLALCCVLLFVATSSGQLRVVTYNTANSGEGQTPSSPRSGMDTILQAIGDEVRNGFSRPIDVLALQEQQFASTTTEAIVSLLNGIYGAGTYSRGTINGQSTGAGRPGLIYNTQTVQLISSVAVGSTSGSGAQRQPIRYQLRPVGYDANADFYVYSNHYKAGSSGSDQSARQVEATFVRADADALGQGAHIIYAGDFNIRSSSEGMFTTLTGAGNGQAFDPINNLGTWHNSSARRITHTQSPYNPAFNDPTLIAGGMDDRFDFQLVTAEFQDNEGLSYLANSYRAFGNNGTHSLNDFINDSSNTAAPTNVLNALASVSDHLPVVADYQVPAIMSAGLSTVPNRVIQGANVPIDVEIWNSANVVAANGADELDYTLNGSGGFIGMAAGTDMALGGRQMHQLTMDTSTVGLISATASIATSSPQVPNSVINQNDQFTVVAPSNPSFHPITDENTLDVDFGILIPSGDQQTQVASIFNLLGSTASSNLDLDTITPAGDTAELGNDLAPFANLFAGQGVTFNLTAETTTSGVYAASWQLDFSDEDIPGEQTATLNITATATVALLGDANLDGSVDGIDFTIWNDNKFQSGTDWSSGDFNFDGVTDGTDFTLWNDFKFQSVALLAVPEPTTLLSAWLGLLLLAMRRISQPIRM